MIEEVTFKNVLSYKDEVTFSFEATDDRILDSSHVVVMPNGTRLLRLGVVYGANASGKSNLLYAINGLRDFWVSDPQNMDSPTGFEPFLLDKDTPEQPSEFSLKFWVNGVRYWYQLKVTRKRVLFEKLSFYKTVQPVRIFERKLEGDKSILSFNPSVLKVNQEEHKALTLYCLPNMSVFAARGHVNIKLEHVDDVRKWIYAQIMPMIGPAANMDGYSQRMVRENVEFKDYVLGFLHMADFNITGFKDVKDGRAMGFEHTVENERGQEQYELSTEQQSNGTRRVMGVEAAIFKAVSNNAVLCIDEIESSIHPRLMEYVIQEYLLRNSESQLLVTTHYDRLLDTIGDLIRKDNVWFVEKARSGVSELYSLVEFNGLNKISHIDRAYIDGQFGALPNIKD